MQYYPNIKFDFKMFSKNEIINLLGENNLTITDIIEKNEPDQDLNGEMMKVESLILCVEKYRSQIQIVSTINILRYII